MLLKAVVSLAIVLALAGPAAAQGVSRFEDDAGAVHYTNVPADPRYRLLQASAPLAAVPAPAAQAERPPEVPWRTRFADTIKAAVERYRVDRRLVEAVIAVESAGNPQAVSPKGALGLMQLMPARAAELGVRNPLDPHQNVDGGVRHLRDLLQRFTGNVTLALAAYNAGEAAVRTYRGVPPFPETQDYVRKIGGLYTGSGLLDGAGATGSGKGTVVTAPQVIYRETAEDGSIVFTNLPPRQGRPAQTPPF